MAFDNRLSVAILRVPEGLDYSKIFDEEDQGALSSCELTLSQPPSRAENYLHTSPSAHMMHADSNLNIAHLSVSDSISSSPFPSISKEGNAKIHNFTILSYRFIKSN